MSHTDSHSPTHTNGHTHPHGHEQAVSYAHSHGNSSGHSHAHMHGRGHAQMQGHGHAHKHAHVPETQTVLYATAESANHEYLSRATGYPVVADARELSALEHEHITLVPACTSRDLSAITQAAQTMRWLKERDAHRSCGGR